MNERYTVDDIKDIEDRVQTFECHTLHDNTDDTFYIILDTLENVQALADKLNKSNEPPIERYMVDDAGTLIDNETFLRVMKEIEDEYNANKEEEKL